MTGKPPTAPTPAAPAPSAEGHPDRWRILAVLCAALCMVVLDNSILSVAVPSLGAQLDASEPQLQWIVAAYGLVIAAFLLPLAGIGDRYGRRRMLLIGVTLFGVASAVASFAQDPQQLMAARALQGIGGAATMPATLSVLSNVFADHERPRAIAIWTAVSSLAAAAGPVIGGLLLARFWWGSVFLVNVPFCALVVWAGWRLVPDSSDPATPPLDKRGSVLWSVGLALLLFAFIEGGDKGWTHPLVIGPLLTAAVALFAFSRWERTTPHPLLSPAAMRKRTMQAGVLIVPVLFFTTFGLQFVLTQWLQGVRGLSALAAGACFVPHAAAILCGSLVSTRLSARAGLGRAAAIGLGLMAVGVGSGIVFEVDLAVVLVLVTVVGLGMGLAAPAGVELIMGSVPPTQAGQAAGVSETLVEAGGALGVAVLGSILTGAAGGAAALAHDRLAGPDAAEAHAVFTDALAAPFAIVVVVLVAAAFVTLTRVSR